MNRLDTDILILGSGGAGLFAALHARAGAPDASVTVAVKGLLGKSGCTRMVQGGYNVALGPGDSIERHFRDTVEGGAWLNDQELAWKLVETAPERVRELENDLGCFFDRGPDGGLHRKAFAGQSFDRTVHKGDLTGIEIVGRLAERVWSSGIRRLEDHRAVALLPDASGEALAAVLFIEMRSGAFTLVRARAVLLATGGGPTLYRYHTPSGDKSCDGMAMALRAGLALRDMEMVQFHPTGLLAGPGTRMTGTVLEEGLRGSGGWLLTGSGERFMERIDPRAERATRDVISRAMIEEIRAGRGTPNGGLYLKMSHLGPAAVRARFKGMVERCADCGFDLAGGLVEVIPTAHYLMGGVVFAPNGSTALPGLFAAGEDSGGVHGGNRLGGNGVADSTVFGGLAGDRMAAWLRDAPGFRDPDFARLDEALARTLAPLRRPAPDRLAGLRERLSSLMWDKVGVLRDGPGLAAAVDGLAELAGELAETGAGSADPAFNLAWHEWLNLENLILAGRAIAASALARENSRGAHWRSDFPEAGDLAASRTTEVSMQDGALRVALRPVAFTRLRPEPEGGKDREPEGGKDREPEGGKDREPEGGR